MFLKALALQIGFKDLEFKMYSVGKDENTTFWTENIWRVKRLERETPLFLNY